METHFAITPAGHSLGRLHRLFTTSKAVIPPPERAAPLLPEPRILAMLEGGERLTTGQVIARMGLLATPLLQQRVSRALVEYGFQCVRAHGRAATWQWTVAPLEIVSQKFRRVHEEADRARGLSGIRPAPAWAGRVATYLGWRS